jgi:hypothetical protein
VVRNELKGETELEISDHKKETPLAGEKDLEETKEFAIQQENLVEISTVCRIKEISKTGNMKETKAKSETIFESSTSS